MVSRSQTYFRSDSTISLIIICQADSLTSMTAFVDSTLEAEKLKGERAISSSKGEGGIDVKADSGKRPTMMVTILITYERGENMKQTQTIGMACLDETIS